MNSRYFDVIVAKEYEINNTGKPEKKTAWNRIGRAWPSKSGEAINFELYLFPNQRYVVQLKDRQTEPTAKSEEASL